MNQRIPLRILIIGNQGQVGWELQQTTSSLGQVVVAGRSRCQVKIDLEQPDSIRSAIDLVKPDVIINASAYTAVDKAETDRDAAYAVNAEAPGIIAEAAVKNQAVVIHYSTDYVFPGNSDKPYLEDDVKQPINVYGETKLKGEQAIQQFDIPHMILRTSWVYANRGHNFLLTMLRLMKEREQVGVVDDQVGSPTLARQIAEVTAMLIAQSVKNNQLQAFESGVCHLTSSGETSWCGFARKIRELAIGHGLLPTDCATINPIDSSAFSCAAARPEYSVMNTDKLYRQFSLRIPDWQLGLEQCLNSMAET